MTRTFVTEDASEAFAAKGAPLMLGMVGPSGSGKTFSALRVATGIQKVVGGDIFVVDTEQRRSLHYANEFRFKHVDFQAPYGSTDYQDALRYCKAQGAGVIVIDSCTHEHTGPGGLLEQHEAELTRMAGTDYAKRDRMSIGAWAKPKALQRKLITTITTELAMPVIFCFRAKTGTKPAARGAADRSPVEMGYSMIGDEAWLFELAVNFLFLPGSEGVPTWQSDKPGEHAAIKCPKQHHWLKERGGAPVDEAIGQRLADWARGGVVSRPAAQPDPKPIAPEDLAPWADELEGMIDEAKTPADMSAIVALIKSPTWKAFKASDETRAGDLATKTEAARERIKAAT
jgi:ABC-type oligopeptide transport system ATPase subunit